MSKYDEWFDEKYKDKFWDNPFPYIALGFIVIGLIGLLF